MQRSLQEDAKLDNPAETELRQLISVASLCGFSEVLKVLLEQEAQLRFPEQYSTMSPLDGAMALNDESAVACVLQDLSITEDQFSKAIQWLLSKNSVNVTFETAVDLACSREHFNALRTLLTEQAKLTFAEHGIMTHLDKAIALNCEAAVAHLLSNDLTISEDQLSKALQWLLNQKLLDDCTLKTAISLACKINKLDALKTLLKQQTKLGKTPLESAMELEDRSSVKYLLAKDLTVTAKEYVKAILWLVTNKAVDLKVCWLIWCIPTMLVRKAFFDLDEGYS